MFMAEKNKETSNDEYKQSNGFFFLSSPSLISHSFLEGVRLLIVKAFGLSIVAKNCQPKIIIMRIN